ncbi:inorganic diphosphatase [Bordetella holmesii]|uniref:Inorganic pyrophosphatase n=2 Tax=Bordetella holmesii TaxID=35814 RepID=A0A158M3L2_9BORD|nr:inorganic diphosphatase [Bordetella holmesii]AHV92574.1 inorganic pyrophosphatase family protein [Bordetella holmesii ATCC 51541]AIT27801.1 inorganic pyrophosphatase family protein [Bordetella holmesii 44057]EWM40577.1 inorganic pyrophosphatase family protein [Bordetella holmesii 35009]EWM44416.1 inorganic pyrophosphatase family protein [Bordetella holmesii 41130]EWM49383.1 inorganic pyrophosphatase family protein [Bordetella holmesii 70147]
MSFERVPAGKSLPDDFNVIIEIPMNADPVKYEVDKESDAIFVDRFMLTAMHYPCNYGYIPQTLSEDGDPADVLVITPFPIQIGAVVRCRALGVLEMDDESGGDAKLLAVPVDKLYPPYRNIKSYEDLPAEDVARIQHFFEHYKDLEKGKWVKVKVWKGVDAAHAEILRSAERYGKGD